MVHKHHAFDHYLQALSTSWPAHHEYKIAKIMCSIIANIAGYIPLNLAAFIDVQSGVTMVVYLENP